MGQIAIGYVMIAGLLVWTVLALRSGNVPKVVWLWLKKPENAAKGLRVGIAAAVLLFAGVTWIAKPNSELADFRTEATSIAIAVVLIEEISYWRDYLEHKRSIIEQMVSQSREFALDALRIAHREKWLFDGSLHGAWLVGAKLSGAILNFVEFRRANLVDADLTGSEIRWSHFEDAFMSGINLSNADLRGSFLQGALLINADLTAAKLDETNLDGVIYNDSTTWPNRFVPPETAINLDRLEQKEYDKVWQGFAQRFLPDVEKYFSQRANAE